jgi:hypothetical protein
MPVHPWRVGDDPLTGLPEPAATIVAEWRAKGCSDDQIIGDPADGEAATGLTGMAYREGQAEMLARLGHPSHPWYATFWRDARAEVLRRIAANRAHAAAEAEAAKLVQSAALDAALEAELAEPTPTTAETPPALRDPRTEADKFAATNPGRGQDWLYHAYHQQPDHLPGVTRKMFPTMAGRGRNKRPP